MNRIECYILSKRLEDWLVKLLKQQNGKDIILLQGHSAFDKSLANLFGVDSSEKVVALTCFDEDRHRNIQQAVNEKIINKKKYTGISFTLGYEGDMSMKKNDLVIVVVSAGIVNDVMQIARENGATGAVVINGRGTGKEFTSFLGMPIDSEKEIILSVTKSEDTEKITTAISDMLRADKNISGICFSMPVENFQGINLTNKKFTK